MISRRQILAAGAALAGSTTLPTRPAVVLAMTTTSLPSSTAPCHQ